MAHHAPLIATIAAAFGVAFILGLIAKGLRLPPIAGYLIAGIIIGPYTPGFVGDQEISSQLAEIGVILLMFGVGLHFSYRDLMAVRKLALPGALLQMGTATVLGLVLGIHFLGWGKAESLVFGIALSVASTVVLLRALEERQLLDTKSGHIAVGWLIVEDLAIILVLVLMPLLAEITHGGGLGAGEIGMAFLWTALKVGALVASMAIFGRRVLPWALSKVAGTGSSELFTLGVLAIGLSVAFGAAALFDVSFALGAFFAGMVLKESELSHRAAERSLPFRDAFAVLFFVAVGMLVDPAVVTDRPIAVLATLAVIVLGKGLVAFALVKAFRHSTTTSLVIAASLAQVGELSFILMTLGGDLGIVSAESRDLLLAGALLSIFLNPALFALAKRYGRVSPSEEVHLTPLERRQRREHTPINYKKRGHAVVVGYGRVGRRVATSLWEGGHPVVVVDGDEDRVEAIRDLKHDAILGNGVREEVLLAACVDQAAHVFVAVPDALQAGEIVAAVRRLRPKARVVARAARLSEVEHITRRGADLVIMGEQLVAERMAAEVSGPSPRRSPVKPAAKGEKAAPSTKKKAPAS